VIGLHPDETGRDCEAQKYEYPNREPAAALDTSQVSRHHCGHGILLLVVSDFLLIEYIQPACRKRVKKPCQPN
jgi:hypothetical protein